MRWRKRWSRVTRIRPGHADLPGTMKYGYDDVRDVLERSSARETAARVAAGAVARRLLEEFGMEIRSHSLIIGGVRAEVNGNVDWEKVEASSVRCADPEAEPRMVDAIDSAKEAGDTVGGVVEVIVYGVPIGLGSHVQWDRKLDGRLAQALMSINACKAVSIGDGWDSVNYRGSQVHDVIDPVTDPDRPWQRQTNRSGGTEGGMTSGMPLVARFAIKPISTLVNPLPVGGLGYGRAGAGPTTNARTFARCPRRRGYRRGDGGAGGGGCLHGEVRGDNVSETRRELRGIP